MSSPRIVLTASNSEASEWHHSIWQQMLSATIPFKYSKQFIPPDSLKNESWPDGRAKYVPNGLRVVETLLLREYDERDVVTCYVEYLDRFVGPETKVVAIHAHNPLGISYATDVYSKLAGQSLMPLNAHEFIRIVTHPAIQRYKPKIVVGGPGAWQLEKADRLDEFKIHYLIVGEITRGCGRGCQFCSPATKVGRSFPLEHIIASTEVNAREGATEIMFSSEDMFLYEQLPNFTPNVPALETMFRAVKAVAGVETLQTSHITMAPVVKDPSIIERLTPLLVPYSHVHHPDSTDPNKKCIDPIIGLETGSPRLFNTYMKGKGYPYKPQQWRDVVLKGMEILNRHNWFPFCTFIIGLPGETDEDTKQSLDLLSDLRDAKGTFVPTFFVPLEDTRMAAKQSAKLIEMTDLQWEFFFTCWKYNLEFWYGGQKAATKFSLGVPLYYKMIGKKLFGRGIKYPLWRFAGVPDRFMRKHLYLDFTGRKRNRAGMRPFAQEIVPGFETIRGLNMIDASMLHQTPQPTGTLSIAGD